MGAVTMKEMYTLHTFHCPEPEDTVRNGTQSTHQDRRSSEEQKTQTLNI